MLNPRKLHAGRWPVLALPWFLIIGCDPVRPGGFSGEVPGPIRVNLPQTPELAEAVNRNERPAHGGSLQRLRMTRQWSVIESRPLVGDAIPEAGFPLSVQIPVWKWLADALDQTTPNKENFWTTQFNMAGPRAEDYYIYSAYDGTAVVTTASLFIGSGPYSEGLFEADARNLFVVADRAMAIQPLGSSGPSLQVTGGFHRFQRGCTPEGQPTFVEVALDGPIDLVQVGWKDSLAAATNDGDAAVPTCGMDARPVIDLGAVSAPVPHKPSSTTNSPSTPLGMRTMAWSPGSDGLYLMAETEGFRSTPAYAQIDHLTIGESTTTLVTSGDLAPPLAVATNGTSLLFGINHATSRSYLRQSLNQAVLPLQAALPNYYPPRNPLDFPLSPDGMVLAAAGFPSAGLRFFDLRSLRETSVSLTGTYPESELIPRAWAPTGEDLLVEIRSYLTGESRFFIMPLVFTNGLPTSRGPTTPLESPAFLRTDSALDNTQYRSNSSRHFWSATGPQVLLQDAQGARVYNFATQQTTLVVEANRVAPPPAAIDVAVATDDVFAWSMRCLEIGERNCTAELRRLSLSTGVLDTVATAEQPWLFAVSPDGQRIVFADTKNLYLKDLAR